MNKICIVFLGKAAERDVVSAKIFRQFFQGLNDPFFQFSPFPGTDVAAKGIVFKISSHPDPGGSDIFPVRVGVRKINRCE